MCLWLCTRQTTPIRISGGLDQPLPRYEPSDTLQYTAERKLKHATASGGAPAYPRLCVPSVSLVFPLSFFLADLRLLSSSFPLLPSVSINLTLTPRDFHRSPQHENSFHPASPRLRVSLNVECHVPWLRTTQATHTVILPDYHGWLRESLKCLSLIIYDLFTRLSQASIRLARSINTGGIHPQ